MITSTLVAASPPRLTLRISRRAPTFSAAAVSSKTGEGNARIHQGSQQHVAADAGKTLQITNTHRIVILNCRLCAAPGQHFDGQDRVHRAGAKARAIERHVLEAGPLESGSDGVEHLHREGARQLGAGNLHASQLAMMANAQLAKA